MRRQELWTLEYAQNRYLAAASDSQLAERARDIINNIATLTAEGQIGFESKFEDSHWIELFGHVQLEMDFRGASFPKDFLKGAKVPMPTAPSVPTSIQALKELGYDPTGHIIRYGNHSWLKSFFEEGRLRLSPASFYEDSSLNIARRDSELERKVFLPIIASPENSDRQSVVRGTIGRTTRIQSNYYVLCFAETYSHRLFNDFSADACLVVKDWETFRMRILRGVQRLLPGYSEVLTASATTIHTISGASLRIHLLLRTSSTLTRENAASYGFLLSQPLRCTHLTRP